MTSSTLEVRETNILDTGYYSCCRQDSTNKCAKQYIFVSGNVLLHRQITKNILIHLLSFFICSSDNEKLLLPTEEYYVLNHNEPGLIPCRPSHPDVEVSLYRDGRSNRGRENIVNLYFHILEWVKVFFKSAYKFFYSNRPYTRQLIKVNGRTTHLKVFIRTKWQEN